MIRKIKVLKYGFIQMLLKIKNTSKIEHVELDELNDSEVVDYSTFPQYFDSCEFYDDECMFV